MVNCRWCWSAECRVLSPYPRGSFVEQPWIRDPPCEQACNSGVGAGRRIPVVPCHSIIVVVIVESSKYYLKTLLEKETRKKEKLTRDGRGLLGLFFSSGLPRCLVVSSPSISTPWPGARGKGHSCCCCCTSQGPPWCCRGSRSYSLLAMIFSRLGRKKEEKTYLSSRYICVSSPFCHFCCHCCWCCYRCRCRACGIDDVLVDALLMIIDACWCIDIYNHHMTDLFFLSFVCSLRNVNSSIPNGPQPSPSYLQSSRSFKPSLTPNPLTWTNRRFSYHHRPRYISYSYRKGIQRCNLRKCASHPFIQ